MPRPDRSAGVRAAPPNVTKPRRAVVRADGATAAAGAETAAAAGAAGAMSDRRREARAEVAERRREARGRGVRSDAGAVFVAVAGHGGGGQAEDFRCRFGGERLWKDQRRAEESDDAPPLGLGGAHEARRESWRLMNECIRICVRNCCHLGRVRPRF